MKQYTCSVLWGAHLRPSIHVGKAPAPPRTPPHCLSASTVFKKILTLRQSSKFKDFENVGFKTLFQYVKRFKIQKFHFKIKHKLNLRNAYFRISKSYNAHPLQHVATSNRSRFSIFQSSISGFFCAYKQFRMFLGFGTFFL